MALLELCVRQCVSLHSSTCWANRFLFTTNFSVALLFLWWFGFLCQHWSVGLFIFKVLFQLLLLSSTSAHAKVSVDPSKSSATIYVHYYVYMWHLICQSCSVLYWDILYRCIKKLWQKFVAQHVTLPQKINILPDWRVYRGMIFSAVPSEMCGNNCWDYLFYIHYIQCQSPCNLSTALHLQYMNMMCSCFHNKGDWIDMKRTLGSVCNLRTLLHNKCTWSSVCRMRV